MASINVDVAALSSSFLLSSLSIWQVEEHNESDGDGRSQSCQPSYMHVLCVLSFYYLNIIIIRVTIVTVSIGFTFRQLSISASSEQQQRNDDEWAISTERQRNMR